MIQNVFDPECDNDAEGLFVKSLAVALALLIRICASLKIFNNNSIIISMKKYETDTCLSFSSHANLFYNKWLC